MSSDTDTNASACCHEAPNQKRRTHHNALDVSFPALSPKFRGKVGRKASDLGKGVGMVLLERGGSNVNILPRGIAHMAIA